MMEKVRKRIVREKAIIAVYQYILIGATEQEIEDYLTSNAKLEKDELTYSIAFVENIIENIELCKEKIKKCLKTGWTLERLSKMELAILIVGTYELLESENKMIVINEAVELAKKYCDDESYKYINGILNQVV